MHTGKNTDCARYPNSYSCWNSSTYLHQRSVGLCFKFVRGVNAIVKQVRARAAPRLVVSVRERVSYPWLIRHSRGIQPDEQARHVCPVVVQQNRTDIHTCATHTHISTATPGQASKSSSAVGRLPCQLHARFGWAIVHCTTYMYIGTSCRLLRDCGYSALNGFR